MKCRYTKEKSAVALNYVNKLFHKQGQMDLVSFIEKSDDFLKTLNKKEVESVQNNVLSILSSLKKSNNSKGSLRKSMRRFRGGAEEEAEKIGNEKGSELSNMAAKAVEAFHVEEEAAGNEKVGNAVTEGNEKVGTLGGSGIFSKGGYENDAIFPRSRTGLIYSGFWISIFCMCGFSNQESMKNCLGVSGMLQFTKRTLCSKWISIVIPIIEQSNHLFSGIVKPLSNVSPKNKLNNTVLYKTIVNADYLITKHIRSFCRIRSLSSRSTSKVFKRKTYRNKKSMPKRRTQNYHRKNKKSSRRKKRIH